MATRFRWVLVFAAGAIAVEASGAVRCEAGPMPPAKELIRKDRYGDSLPPGAMVRLGTVRFRQRSRHFAFSPNSREIASSGVDGYVRIQDATTGKERCSLGDGTNYFRRISYSLNGKFLAVEDHSTDDVRLWDATTGKCIRKMSCPKEDQLIALDFSQDGRLLAGGYRMKGIVLWDARTGAALQTITKGTKLLHSLAFLPDGKRFLSACDDGSVNLGDKEGRRFHSFPLKFPGSFDLAVSVDGKTLVAGGGRRIDSPAGGDIGGRLAVWDIATGKERRRLETRMPIEDVSLPPNGKTLAYIQDTASIIQLRDMDSWKEIRRLEVPEGKASDLKYSPDGKVLAACVENALELWDVATGRPLASRPGHVAPVSRVAFTANGGQLVSIARNRHLGTARVWDALTGQFLYQLPEDWNWTDGGVLCASRDGKTLLLGDSNSITVWDVAARRPLRRLPIEKKSKPNSSRQIRALALSPDGRRISSISDDGEGRTTFLVCDAVTGAVVNRRVLTLREKQSAALTLSPDGRFVATANGRAVWLRDVASGMVRQTFFIEGASVNETLGGSLAVSNDSRLLAYRTDPDRSPDEDAPAAHRKIHIWELATGKEFPSLAAPWMRAIAFAPNGRTLAAAGGAGVHPGQEERPIHLWDIATGKEVGRFEGHHAFVGSFFAGIGDTALAFSPDGQTLATGLQDSTVLLWDLKPMLRRVQAALPAVRPEDLPHRWAALAGADVREAQASIWSLARSLDLALPFLDKKLKQARAADAERLRRLIAELDSERFTIRQAAAAELRQLDLLAEPALRHALENKPSLESRRRIEKLLAFYRGPMEGGEIRQSLRAIAVLEHMNNEGSRRLLAKLADGAAEARLTREVRAALERMRQSRP